jgi:DNA-binding MarR family transcriptional regulator
MGTGMDDEGIGGGGAGYWYQDSGSGPEAVDVLNLLRKYREAERRMRHRTRDSMGMGETDLIALRFLLRASRTGRPIRQRDLAEALDITSASASALVDRLCRDGYAERIDHPEDRRSVAIRPTRKSDEEVRSTLGEMHRRMLAAAESLTPEETAAVAKFLTTLTNCIE